jgi:hypothetical protein
MAPTWIILPSSANVPSTLAAATSGSSPPDPFRTFGDSDTSDLASPIIVLRRTERLALGQSTRALSDR